jgi:hypothetical protein
MPPGFVAWDMVNFGCRSSHDNPTSVTKYHSHHDFIFSRYSFFIDMASSRHLGQFGKIEYRISSLQKWQTFQTILINQQFHSCSARLSLLSTPMLLLQLPFLFLPCGKGRCSFAFFLSLGATAAAAGVGGGIHLEVSGCEELLKTDNEVETSSCVPFEPFLFCCLSRTACERTEPAGIVCQQLISHNFSRFSSFSSRPL